MCGDLTKVFFGEVRRSGFESGNNRLITLKLARAAIVNVPREETNPVTVSTRTFSPGPTTVQSETD